MEPGDHVRHGGNNIFDLSGTTILSGTMPVLAISLAFLGGLVWLLRCWVWNRQGTGQPQPSAPATVSAIYDPVSSAVSFPNPYMPPAITTQILPDVIPAHRLAHHPFPAVLPLSTIPSTEDLARLRYSLHNSSMPLPEYSSLYPAPRPNLTGARGPSPATELEKRMADLDRNAAMLKRMEEE